MSILVRLLVSIALCGSGAWGQASKYVNVSGGVLPPDQACYDVTHYDLALRVDPSKRRIDGALRMTAVMVEASSVVAIDLDPSLTVEGVESAGAKVARWNHDAGRVVLDFAEERAAGSEIVVTVRYGGRPRVAPRPPWDGGFTWSKTPSGEPWIATTCQGEGGDLWWPCKDHPSEKPASMDLRIEVPKGLVCASNGTLKSSRTVGEWTTFHWHVASPIACYNVALNIAPYEVLEDEIESVAGGKIPVQFFVLPESEARAKKALPEFLGHVRHMERVCGPYPFRHEKYGIAETPHLGMEHQTIIAYGYRFRGLQESYDWLHHHELSHEWWGNLVTCRDWKDMWIHEGIGTYMQALYLEEKYGEKAYDVEMNRTRRQIVGRRPIAPRESQNSKEIYFGGGLPDSDIYYKGSWVMHSLRWLLGDEVFPKVLRRMAYANPAKEKITDGSQVRIVDTEEMVAIAEKVSGVELDWFFEVYLRRGGFPELVEKRVDGVLTLSWKTVDDLPFPMPVPVVVDGELKRVAVDGKSGLGTIDVGDAECVVDPRNLILKKLPGRRR